MSPLAFVVAGAAVLFAMRGARASVPASGYVGTGFSSGEPYGPPAQPEPYVFESDYPVSNAEYIPQGSAVDFWDFGAPFEDNYPMPDLTDPAGANVAAFLALIRRAEGTELRPDPYRVVYGYGWTLQDLSAHPVATGEWTGERLSDEQCAGAGFGPGCKSTAAGAYQFNWPTWVDVMGPNADFYPETQDAAAINLLERIGALADIRAGNLEAALSKASYRWASLPPKRVAGQPTQTLQWARNVFLDNGGFIA